MKSSLVRTAEDPNCAISWSFCHTQMRLERAKKNIDRANEAVLGVVSPTKKPDQRIKWGEFVPLKNVELLRLGYRIRGARKVLGYGQKGFAVKCGLGWSYLGEVERGERNITFGILCAICLGLECDIATITKGIPHLAAAVFSEGSICVSS